MSRNRKWRFTLLLIAVSVGSILLSRNAAPAAIAFVKTSAQRRAMPPVRPYWSLCLRRVWRRRNSVILAFAMVNVAGAVSASDSVGNSYGVDTDVTNASGVRTVILAAHGVAALAAGNTKRPAHPLVASGAERQ